MHAPAKKIDSYFSLDTDRGDVRSVALLVLLRFVKATLKKRVPLERELSLLARAALAIGFLFRAGNHHPGCRIKILARIGYQVRWEFYANHLIGRVQTKLMIVVTVAKIA